jgi:oligoendopeptidase F
MTEPNVDTIIGKYIELRNEKQAKEAAHKAETKKIDEKLKKLEAWLHLKMSTDGVKAFNTDSGTAYTTTVEQATVSDMNALLEFIKKNEAWHLLEKRVSKTGVRELLDADEPIPPGVNWYVTTAINIRKPNER